MGWIKYAMHMVDNDAQEIMSKIQETMGMIQDVMNKIQEIQEINE